MFCTVGSTFLGRVQPNLQTSASRSSRNAEAVETIHSRIDISSKQRIDTNLQGKVFTYKIIPLRTPHNFELLHFTNHDGEPDLHLSNILISLKAYKPLTFEGESQLLWTLFGPSSHPFKLIPAYPCLLSVVTMGCQVHGFLHVILDACGPAAFQHQAFLVVS